MGADWRHGHVAKFSGNGFGKVERAGVCMDDAVCIAWNGNSVQSRCYRLFPLGVVNLFVRKCCNMLASGYFVELFW